MKPLTILITGASSGLGETMVLRFAKQGHTVLAVARNQNKLDRLARRRRGRVFAYGADVSNLDQVKTVFSKILAEHPRIDALINNASVFHSCRFFEEKMENIDRLVDTNLKGTMYCTRLVLPGMVKRRDGRIINISSVSGTRGIPSQSIYGASKHGVNGFSDVIGQEVKEHGVLVTSICPGGIATPLWNQSNPYFGDVNNLTHPSEIAELVEFILRQPKRLLYKKVILFPTGEWH